MTDCLDSLKESNWGWFDYSHHDEVNLDLQIYCSVPFVDERNATPSGIYKTMQIMG